MSAIRLFRHSTTRLARVALSTGPLCQLTRSAAARPPSAGRRSFWSSSASTATATATPTVVVEELASSSIPHVADSLLPILLAVVLSASSSSDDDNDDPAPPWTVQQTSKGFGAFTSRPIQRGELLIAERPLCVWPQGLSEGQARELFNQLGEKEQKVFMALSRTEGEGPVKELDEIRAIRATNGFALQLPGAGTTAGFVFPKIARINHSCTPNASQAMNYETLRMELYSLTPLAPSSELCIEYLPLITSSYSERQSALAASFGFSACLCPTCVAPLAQREQSDERRREIKKLGEEVRKGRSDRGKTMVRLERIRVLLSEEGYVGLPEFEDQSVSNAYAVYAGMWARSQREG